ncbi:asparagine synthase (glutamine-hydrolyzing) [Qipengyuania sp. 6B39]|uniref:asparagine synthase (glutamine-hydrolyzing) n=1 Tax=Qipengyuania proteolytica TaxID=2867239 RepID=UPI001C8AB4E8|nr:asparagine synthase (glutamine-hydrolyzing) [Qipengyuania proteolytica]MBX7495826.1 asparagine synthase (glutamine-hydrolyzing) [Qipengyuania proteolytica]
MCGIAGFIDFSGTAPVDPAQVAAAMCDALHHRGPDAGSVAIEAWGKVALGHRRLSIIDLTTSGAQPMASASGRYLIVFNGEIYNFLELRRELEAGGVGFRGHSDTEVLLASFEKHGIRQTLERANGMFALALYDRVLRHVTFARDRLGKKPLYLGVGDGVLAFGSELKALRQHPAFAAPRISGEAFRHYARLGYVPAPLSIFEDIGKLPPASFVTLSIDADLPSLGDIRASTAAYWSMMAAAQAGLSEPFADEEAALDTLEETLGTAVEQRLIADVPVGAFLSGGIDSSLVCALMQERLAGKARTFTVGFEDQAFDESKDAAELAAQLGTEHTELALAPDAALDAAGGMHDIFDEPFADPSQIPSLLLSRLIREQVTVAISGDGGDEFFAGYKRYPQMAAMEQLAKRLPTGVWRGASVIPFPVLCAASKLGQMFVAGNGEWQASGDRIEKLLDILAEPDFRHRYERFVSQWSGSDVGGHPRRLPASPYTTHPLPEGLDPQQQMMFLDAVSYLTDDVLVKVDRTSMAASLEVRSPLLDYRIVEASWRMPASLRWPDGGPGKIALRRLLARRVPERMIDRPKRGFGIPLNDWLRGPLRPLAEEQLSAARLRELGFFDCDAVRRKWSEHLSGQRNWGFHLWTCIAFGLWHRRWMGEAAEPRSGARFEAV